jgi:dTDP-L-rhamnose 4-epimerase
VAEQILVTGGAGFVGSHLADELLAAGYRVRALDSLVEQVHGPGRARPPYLAEDVELVTGDVRDPDAVRAALDGADAVVHLAARVGVAQSMYAPAEYTEANTAGTGVLLEALLERPVRKLVVASSMSVYGEGAYSPAPAVERTREQLERRDWEPRGPHDERLTPVPTPESKPPALSSIYALTKHDQERLCLLHGAAYGIPAVALRFFNVYGPRQALSNPYTGALAIFASRLLNGRAPVVYEDGNQRRDFVHVSDVARACRLALEGDGADGLPVNVGGGAHATILEVARKLAHGLGSDVEPELPGTFRAGDIRHCFADVTRAREALGFEARVALGDGLVELAAWLEGQSARDRFDEAAAELSERGLTA